MRNKLRERDVSERKISVKMRETDATVSEALTARDDEEPARELDNSSEEPAAEQTPVKIRAVRVKP